jgi:hypothetical protein
MKDLVVLRGLRTLSYPRSLLYKFHSYPPWICRHEGGKKRKEMERGNYQILHNNRRVRQEETEMSGISP